MTSSKKKNSLDDHQLELNVLFNLGNSMPTLEAPLYGARNSHAMKLENWKASSHVILYQSHSHEGAMQQRKASRHLQSQ